MPYKGDYNRPGGSQKQQPSGDHRRPRITNQAPARRPARKTAPPEETPQAPLPGVLTSPDNDKVRFLRNLLSKKDRQAARHFLIEGVRLVEEALRGPKPPLYTLYDPDILARTEAGQRLLMRLIEMADDKRGVYPATARVMEMVTDTVTPQGVASAVPFLSWDEARMNSARLHLILDSLQDPGNLGTILRSAWAAGESSIWLSEGCVDFYSPKVARAGMGAHFHVPAVPDLNWTELNRRLALAGPQQIWLAASEDGSAGAGLPHVSYTEVDWTRPQAVIIGNEAHGPGQEASLQATHRLNIPMPGGAESLNAAVAASIIIFEALRQRQNRQ